MLSREYHERLLAISESGGSSDPFFPVDDEEKVRYADVLSLPVSNGDIGTSSWRYQSIVHRLERGGMADSGVVFIADPYYKVNSADLARITCEGREKRKAINITDYKDLFGVDHRSNFWSPDFQAQFGSLEKDVLYVVSGFENLPEKDLLGLLEFPYFQIGHEHFQEKKCSWRNCSYDHRTLLFFTGIAEEAFFEAGMKHSRENLGAMVGTMNNFLERAFHANLYCVNDNTQ